MYIPREDVINFQTKKFEMRNFHYITNFTRSGGLGRYRIFGYKLLSGQLASGSRFNPPKHKKGELPAQTQHPVPAWECYITGIQDFFYFLFLCHYGMI
jgi:hypothetical protein